MENKLQQQMNEQRLAAGTGPVSAENTPKNASHGK